MKVTRFVYMYIHTVYIYHKKAIEVVMALVPQDGMCCMPGVRHHLHSVDLYDVDGPEGEAWCASACSSEPQCRFFSFAGSFRLVKADS